LVLKYFHFGQVLDLPHNRLFEFAYAQLVSPVKRPLFDSLRPHQACLQEDLHVFTGGRLAYTQFLRDQHAAHSIFDQIPVHLRPEVFSRLLQPVEDLQPSVVRQGPQDQFRFHIDN
jgi:hypothetical protein